MKRTTEEFDCAVQPSASRTPAHKPSYPPAVNYWAIFIRPLSELFKQSQVVSWPAEAQKLSYHAFFNGWASVLKMTLSKSRIRGGGNKR